MTGSRGLAGLGPALAAGTLMTLAGCLAGCLSGGSDRETDPGPCQDVPMLEAAVDHLILCPSPPENGVFAAITLGNPSSCAPVTVSRMEIWWDQRDAFNGPNFWHSDGVIDAGETVNARFLYAPPGPGDDGVELVAFSDAPDTPELHVPICGVGTTVSDEADCPSECVVTPPG